MSEVLQRARLRAEVERLLEGALPGFREDRALAAKVAELIRIAYVDESSAATERIVARYNEVFGVDVEHAPSVDDGPRAPVEEIVGPGWFGDYLRWTREHEAPASYHLFAALAGVSAAVTRLRRPRLAWEARATYPNLYVLLVGPTGARKGSAVERAVTLTSAATGYTILPGEGTHQGLAHALRRAAASTGMSSGLIVAPEYSVLMKEDRNKTALVEWLTDWYDCGTGADGRWERALRGEDEPYLLTYLCPTMIGASNLPWLRKLPESAITGGFLPRQLIVNESGPRHRAWNPRFDAALEAQLRARLTHAVADIPESMTFSDAAQLYIKHYYENVLAAEYAATDDEQFRAWLDRKQAQIMKVGALWQLIDRPGARVVELDAITRARTLVDWLDPCVRTTYGALGVAPGGESTADLVALLRRRRATSRERALPMSTIVRALRNKYPAHKIREALEVLKLGGEAQRAGDIVDGIKWYLT